MGCSRLNRSCKKSTFFKNSLHSKPEELTSNYKRFFSDFSRKQSKLFSHSSPRRKSFRMNERISRVNRNEFDSSFRNDFKLQSCDDFLLPESEARNVNQKAWNWPNSQSVERLKVQGGWRLLNYGSLEIWTHVSIPCTLNSPDRNRDEVSYRLTSNWIM